MLHEHICGTFEEKMGNTIMNKIFSIVDAGVFWCYWHSDMWPSNNPEAKPFNTYKCKKCGYKFVLLEVGNVHFDTVQRIKWTAMDEHKKNCIGE